VPEEGLKLDLKDCQELSGQIEQEIDRKLTLEHNSILSYNLQISEIATISSSLTPDF